MRIVKYIFLLILLALVAISVYIGTQNGSFDVKRSKTINIPQSVIYQYVNDYKNWQDWAPWLEKDKTIQFQYSQKTTGTGSTFSWLGKDSEGKMKTVKNIENDSVFQKLYFDKNEPNDVIWGFQKFGNSTKVTLRMKGEMSFKMKFLSFFKGGIENIMAPMLEDGLNTIDTILVKELKTYTIKVNGLTRKTGVYYIKQTVTCKISSLSKNTGIMFRKITQFAKDNKITVKGAPFAIYDKYDTVNGIVTVSACLPILEEIFTSEGSDIEGGRFYSYLALKTTLTGDYSHSKKAWDKAYAEIAKRKWMENPEGKYIEVYVKGQNETRRASQWITEIFIPIVEKIKPIEIPLTLKDST
jgi:ribosome-associated toxin RatA of RatAB toxin-antitoxin module